MDMDSGHVAAGDFRKERFSAKDAKDAKESKNLEDESVVSCLALRLPAATVGKAQSGPRSILPRGNPFSLSFAFFAFFADKCLSPTNTITG